MLQLFSYQQNHLYHILYSWNKISLNIGISFQGFLIPNLLINPLASCYLTNLDFWALCNTYFEKIFFSITSFWKPRTCTFCNFYNLKMEYHRFIMSADFIYSLNFLLDPLFLFYLLFEILKSYSQYCKNNELKNFFTTFPPVSYFVLTSYSCL